MTTALNDLHSLLVHELRDLYSAEKQLVKALPRMAKKASHADLREAIHSHLEETKEHVNRLERALSQLDGSARATKCEAMAGLIEEAESTTGDANPQVMDAAIIAQANRIEHYEIAAYGSAVAFAKELQLQDAQELLEETLAEEKKADETLTKLAERQINAQAADKSRSRVARDQGESESGAEGEQQEERDVEGGEEAGDRSGTMRGNGGEGGSSGGEFGRQGRFAAVQVGDLHSPKEGIPALPLGLQSPKRLPAGGDAGPGDLEE